MSRREMDIMSYKLVVIFALFIFVQSDIQSGSRRARGCRVDEDCSEDECCTDPRSPIILSKRTLLETGEAGICKSYIEEGAWCGGTFGSRFCGCVPGTSCEYIRSSDREQIRKDMALGNYRCVRLEE